MKQIAQSIILAVVLTGAVFLGAYAQRSALLAPISPFLVDLEQTIPVTFTLTVDDQTVTVPASVDVTLVVQVRADGSVSPTMHLGKATAPHIAVQQTNPTPSPTAQTVDANGLPYTADVAEGLVLEQVNSPGMFDMFSVAGVIRNNTGRDIGKFDLDINVTTFDAAGRLLDVHSGLLSVDTLRAGGVAPFTVPSMADADQVASYTVQISLD